MFGWQHQCAVVSAGELKNLAQLLQEILVHFLSISNLKKIIIGWNQWWISHSNLKYVFVICSFWTIRFSSSGFKVLLTVSPIRTAARLMECLVRTKQFWIDRSSNFIWTQLKLISHHSLNSIKNFEKWLNDSFHLFNHFLRFLRIS